MAIACNLAAIAPENRPRYHQLIQRIRGAIGQCFELHNGYAYPIDPGAVPLTDAAEWMALETLCCPFLTIQLSASGQQSHWVLTLTGPEGVKPLLDTEFPLP